MKSFFYGIWNSIKSMGAFSAGVFVGVCYGSIVGTLTTYAMLSL